MDKGIFTTIVYARTVDRRRLYLQTGDMVLIVGDSYVRNNWPKSLVVTVDRSEDGLARQAKISKSKGIITRDLCKFYLLEGPDD